MSNGFLLDTWRLDWEDIRPPLPQIRYWPSHPRLDAWTALCARTVTWITNHYREAVERYKTMEQEQSAERPRFANLTEQMLYRFCLDGWGNESVGEAMSAGGYLARISISVQELPEVVDAFSEVLDGSGFSEGVNMANLIGHFLVSEDGFGIVSVARYETERDVRADYRRMQSAVAEGDL